MRLATRRHQMIAFGLLGGLTLLASTGTAQPRWGQPSEPRNGACFYRDTDFEGDYFCLGVGEEISSVPSSMSNEIYSIRTFGNVEVTIFQNSRFGGRSKRFDNDVSDLEDEGWEDRLASMRVMRRGGGSGRGDSGSGRGGNRANGDPDKIVTRAYQDILEREPDSAGLRLYRSRMIDDGWTEDQVRDALRKSPEYREKNTMTPQKAREIVRKAYLSVLNREPDPASQGFVDKVLRNKWTQADVERELRKSDEYQNKKR